MDRSNCYQKASAKPLTSPSGMMCQIYDTTLRVNREKGFIRKPTSSESQVEMRGLTGRIKFDQHGLRTDFTLEIVELKKDGLLKVGTYNESTEKVNFTRKERSTCGRKQHR